MSLFGNLLTTYEMIQGASGQTPHSAEKDGDADAAKRALIPYGHTTLPVSLTVLVDANGCIRGVAKRKSTIIIPCTEESMGRTIKPVPHPLFDQLQYVDSGRSPEKTSMYLQQLAKWKGDDAKLEAVFKCVSEHSISEAAAHYGVELTDKDDKAGVCFEVQIGLEDSDLSNDVDIRNRWIAYLQRSQHRLGKDVFGEDLYTPTTNFPKKVVSSDANAKLLSANDSTNFTFRGRFSSKEQALLVDSASSQKINSTLRWLVNNHGTLTGNQAIVVWAIKRPEEKPVLNPQSGSFDFDDSFSSIADESKALHDDISDALNATNVQYAKIFSRVLRGYEGAEDLKKHNDPMVVVILDAATTGRLGVTFYCELQKDEYIDDFFFTSRSRRPPLDRLNALLSFCYSILTNDCIAALQGVGLDPYVGFMHTDRPGRASLALDLVEEFRPVLADRFVLTLVNTGAVKPGDFEIRENGGVLLSDFGRKKVLTAWQKKKSDQILHPFLQEKISWGLVPYVQALLLARSLRGDLDDYPPFMWK